MANAIPMPYEISSGTRNVEHPSAICRHTPLLAHTSAGTNILLGLGFTVTRTPHRTAGLLSVLGVTTTIAVSLGIAIGCWLRHRVLLRPFAVKLDPEIAVKALYTAPH